MKITLELPDTLVTEIKLRALQDGRRHEDTFADLLRMGLADASRDPSTKVRADATMLRNRKDLVARFVAGDWGVELEGYESSTTTDRA